MIKIISVGKIKEKYLKDGINEYLKRLTKYTKIELIEVEDVDYNEKEKTLLKERDNIMKYINQKDYIITLEIEGKELNSVEFSKLIDSALSINSNITFIIGGSYGLHNDIKQLSNYKLSFSKLTFPHQLFRLILLEQLYRCFKIIKNESYNK
jgi:23S rRNA (pseudouridine1915-N3)-methyltransferase